MTLREFELFYANITEVKEWHIYVIIFLDGFIFGCIAISLIHDSWRSIKPPHR